MLGVEFPLEERPKCHITLGDKNTHRPSFGDGNMTEGRPSLENPQREYEFNEGQRMYRKELFSLKSRLSSRRENTYRTLTSDAISDGAELTPRRPLPIAPRSQEGRVGDTYRHQAVPCGFKTRNFDTGTFAVTTD